MHTPRPVNCRPFAIERTPPQAIAIACASIQNGVILTKKSSDIEKFPKRIEAHGGSWSLFREATYLPFCRLAELRVNRCWPRSNRR
jgi:hypothetical protein